MKKFAWGIFCTVVFLMYFTVLPGNALAASPDEFCSKYLGKSVDVDNYPANQPYQCYDLWARFVMDEYGTSRPIIISPTGCAEDIWNNFEGLGLSAYFTMVSGSPRDGDWVIYDWPGSSNSHVGMFRSDNGDGTILILHQNYLGQTVVTQDNMNKKNILGYIRPNSYLKAGQETPQSQVSVSINKSEVLAGEKVIISFSAAGATGFTLALYKDGEKIETIDSANSPFSRSFSDLGNYSAYVTPYNKSRSLGMGRVTFSVVPGNIENTGDIPSRGYTGRERERPISIVVNGKKIDFDQPPVVLNGRTMVPMRAIFEALGTQVHWEIGKQTATATKNKTTIIVTVGSEKAIVNGREKTLEVPVQMFSNRIMVPVRFISESLGAKVSWEIKSQTVSIEQ